MSQSRHAAPRAVVFDLDGTLVDSAADIAAALNLALAEAGIAPFDVDAVKSMVGGGSRRLIERALAARSMDAPARVDRLVTRFEQHYVDTPCRHTRAFPGAGELLAELAGAGIRLGLCTNKAAAITASLLAALGLERFLEAVVSGSEGLPMKPDPAMLLATLSRLGIAPAEAVMVGDSAADVGCARAAGCGVVLVSFGYSSVPVSMLGADAVVDRLSDVSANLGLRAPGQPHWDSA